MENRALPQVGEFLPLNVTQYRKDAYTMKINVSDFTGFDVYLKDYFTNQEILLENGGTTNYSFTVNTANAASTNADRFAFFFLQAQLNTDQPKAETNFTLYPNPVKGSVLFLNANTSFDNAQIEIYNLVGQKVMSFKADFGGNNQITIPVSELNTGMYLINAKTNTGLNFSSKFIKN
jgi:hypothetical protein